MGGGVIQQLADFFQSGDPYFFFLQIIDNKEDYH